MPRHTTQECTSSKTYKKENRTTVHPINTQIKTINAHAPL